MKTFNLPGCSWTVIFEFRTNNLLDTQPDRQGKQRAVKHLRLNDGSHNNVFRTNAATNPFKNHNGYLLAGWICKLVTAVKLLAKQHARSHALQRMHQYSPLFNESRKHRLGLQDPEAKEI